MELGVAGIEACGIVFGKGEMAWIGIGLLLMRISPCASIFCRVGGRGMEL